MIQIILVTDDSPYSTAIMISRVLGRRELSYQNAQLIAKVQQYSTTITGVILENKFMLTAIIKGALFQLIDTKLKQYYPMSRLNLMQGPI